MDKLINTLTFVFNPQANGGESLLLFTRFMDNGDDGGEGIFVEHELTLCSYGNSASFNLYECITPENLRVLADKLEDARKYAEQKKAGA